VARAIVRRQVRPFGANALLASYNAEDGPQLYSIDTSGVSARFFATAMGKVRHVGEI
jgi:20S proteasome alpha/beta subunit